LIYELRTYIILPGHMEDILDRFRTKTMGIFSRLGFEILGFWTVTEPHADRELVYLLRWDSAEASDAGWAAFRDDPEWIETRRVTEENGHMVEEEEEKTMVATDFSPMA